MNELTRKLRQFSITVVLVHSNGIFVPGSGARWILCRIFVTGTMLAIRASSFIACETLYSPVLGSGFAWNGVNHSTYARCCEGWLFLPNRCSTALELMLKMARIWTTRYARCRLVCTLNCGGSNAHHGFRPGSSHLHKRQGQDQNDLGLSFPSYLSAMALLELNLLLSHWETRL